MTVITITHCSICGKETEWDENLGPKALCVDCWDKSCDTYNPLAANQRRYYQEHKEELAANKRRYRQEHKGEVAAYQRRYRQEHKGEVVYAR